MGRPAGVADPGRSVEVAAVELARELGELARRPQPLDAAVLDGGDAGGIVAAIFEPPQRVDQRPGYRSGAENADDAAHVMRSRHSLASLGLARPLRFAEACGPAPLDLEFGPLDGERVGLDIAGHHAARTDIGAIADPDRRHQRAVGADERRLRRSRSHVCRSRRSCR